MVGSFLRDLCDLFSDVEPPFGPVRSVPPSPLLHYFGDCTKRI